MRFASVSWLPSGPAHLPQHNSNGRGVKAIWKHWGNGWGQSGKSQLLLGCKECLSKEKLQGTSMCKER